VDDIYQQATIKLEPVPLYAFRDSALIFWHHHLIIEGQRKNRKGLIAGIKKDVVLSGKVTRDTKSNRVAIYGWHYPDGRPIQSLYVVVLKRGGKNSSMDTQETKSFLTQLSIFGRHTIMVDDDSARFSKRGMQTDE
jgi:hypothetical protein